MKVLDCWDRVGSNRSEGKDIRLLCLLCVVKVAACATGWLISGLEECYRVCVCDIETCNSRTAGPRLQKSSCCVFRFVCVTDYMAQSPGEAVDLPLTFCLQSVLKYFLLPLE